MEQEEQKMSFLPNQATDHLNNDPEDYQREIVLVHFLSSSDRERKSTTM